MDYDGRTRSDHYGNEVLYVARDGKEFMGAAAFDACRHRGRGIFRILGKGCFLAFLAELRAGIQCRFLSKRLFYAESRCDCH